MSRPDPEAVAKKMVHVCEVLWHFGNSALRRAKDDTSTLRARDYASSGRSVKGDIDDQTGNVGIARSRGDRKTLYDRMAVALIDLDRQLSDVAGLFELATSPVDETEAKRKLRPPGAGDCSACGCWVTGEGNDRIKSGYCGRHYKKWSRVKGEMSRSDFEHLVRREMETNDDP